ncbi:hypothetical protein HDU91_006667 [Kappamyces sp. JEL0680]|nr:hypothetical protein HDU91_006667 [Kappamyces sp. JEL0680]
MSCITTAKNIYDQCGGQEYTGPDGKDAKGITACCPSGSDCFVLSSFYFQCLPPISVPKTGAVPAKPSTKPVVATTTKPQVVTTTIKKATTATEPHTETTTTTTVDPDTSVGIAITSTDVSPTSSLVLSTTFTSTITTTLDASIPTSAASSISSTDSGSTEQHGPGNGVVIGVCIALSILALGSVLFLTMLRKKWLGHRISERFSARLSTLFATLDDKNVPLASPEKQLDLARYSTDSVGVVGHKTLYEGRAIGDKSWTLNRGLRK